MESIVQLRCRRPAKSAPASLDFSLSYISHGVSTGTPDSMVNSNPSVRKSVLLPSQYFLSRHRHIFLALSRIFPDKFLSSFRLWQRSICPLLWFTCTCAAVNGMANLLFNMARDYLSRLWHWRSTSYRIIATQDVELVDGAIERLPNSHHAGRPQVSYFLLAVLIFSILLNAYHLRRFADLDSLCSRHTTQNGMLRALGVFISDHLFRFSSQSRHSYPLPNR